RAAVAGGDREGLALRIGLLEDVVAGGRAVRLRAGFATTDRDVDDAHRVVGDRLVEVIHQRLRVEAGGGVQGERLHATGDAGDVLAVQIPLAVAAGVAAAAVHRHHVHRDAAEARVLAEERAEVALHVRHAAFGDDAHRDRGAGRRAARVVDRGEIGRVVRAGRAG